MLRNSTINDVLTVLTNRVLLLNVKILSVLNERYIRKLMLSFFYFLVLVAKHTGTRLAPKRSRKIPAICCDSKGHPQCMILRFIEN